MSEFTEEAKGSDKFTLHPKAPVTNDVAGKDDCGRAGGRNLNVVRVIGWAVPDTASGEHVPALDADIGVAAAQDERDEVPRVIVEEALVVAPVPLVDTDGEPAERQHRAVRIGTFVLAQRFAPAELERAHRALGVSFVRWWPRLGLNQRLSGPCSRRRGIGVRCVLTYTTWP